MKEAYAGSTAYRTAGRGAPVVLIHGVGLDATIWEAQAAALAERYRVVAYDMLGHGQSACPPGARALGDFVDQLAELLDALELRRVALVGFSMGGLVARAFAAAYPERVSHLALLSTAYRAQPRGTGGHPHPAGPGGNRGAHYPRRRCARSLVLARLSHRPSGGGGAHS